MVPTQPLAYGPPLALGSGGCPGAGENCRPSLVTPDSAQHSSSCGGKLRESLVSRVVAGHQGAGL